MHDICPFAKNPCRENLYSAKREQFMCTKNPCLLFVFLQLGPIHISIVSH